MDCKETRMIREKALSRLLQSGRQEIQFGLACAWGRNGEKWTG